jgi:hypothetical protein
MMFLFVEVNRGLPWLKSDRRSLPSNTTIVLLERALIHRDVTSQAAP